MSTLYAGWFRDQGVENDHIITINLEDRRNKKLRDPDVLLDYKKMKQEEASLCNIDDSFKKIIIVGEDTPVLRNEAGITTILSLFWMLTLD